jgi:two-component system phosphate regulon sensor histidine kinase PhoR
MASLGLLRTLGAAMDQGLLACDTAERILVATPMTRRLLHLPNDCEGSTLATAGADFRAARLVDRCLQEGEPVGCELSDADVDLVLQAIPTGSAPVAVVVLVRDETRVRRLERVRRDFVTNVSHELRTPITAIRLLAETLQNGAIGDPEVASAFVQRIALEVAHMGQMVEELLELSAIESGRRPLTRERVRVDELFQTIDRLRPLAEERRLDLRVEITAQTPPILGDAGRLGQVLRNLVHNAIKFTPPDGVITVSAAPLDGDRVELRCADTGVGINPEDLPRIFERFWKADSSRQRDGEGTGLGLAIARHVVEAHEGQIRAESVPRKGATFVVELPAATATASPDPRSASVA